MLPCVSISHASLQKAVIFHQIFWCSTFAYIHRWKYTNQLLFFFLIKKNIFCHQPNSAWHNIPNNYLTLKCILHWSGSDRPNTAECWVLQYCCWRTTKIRPPGSSKIANRLIGDLVCSNIYLRLQSWIELSVNHIPHDSTHPPYNITPNNKTVLLTQEMKIGRISLQEVRCTSGTDIKMSIFKRICTLHCAWWVILFVVAYILNAPSLGGKICSVSHCMEYRYKAEQHD